MLFAEEKWVVVAEKGKVDVRKAKTADEYDSLFRKCLVIQDR